MKLRYKSTEEKEEISNLVIKSKENTPFEQKTIENEYEIEDEEETLVVIKRNKNKDTFDKISMEGKLFSSKLPIELPEIEQMREERPDYFFISFGQEEIVIDVKEKIIMTFFLDKKSKKTKVPVSFFMNDKNVGKIENQEYGFLDEFMVEQGEYKIKAEVDEKSLPVIAFRIFPKEEKKDYSKYLEKIMKQERKLYPKKWGFIQLPTQKAKILLALQYWSGDEQKAYDLARLIADIEDEYNNEAIFLFSGRFDVGPTDQRTVEYVSKKFETIVFKGSTEKTGHPDGCNGLWIDTMNYANHLVMKKKKDIDAVLTFEPDCVPMKKDWIKNIHNEWKESKCLVLGHFVPKEHNTTEEHINGNMVVSPILPYFVNINHIQEKFAWDVWLYKFFKHISKQSKEICSILSIYNKYIFNMENNMIDHFSKIYNLANHRLNKKIYPSLIHGIKDDSAIDIIRERNVIGVINKKYQITFDKSERTSFSKSIVYTYYDNLNWDMEWMLEAWKKSWKNRGWEPRILGPEDAKKHPKYEEVLKKINSMPTVNDRRYEKACYLRWVAMACVGGLMTDIDVININYGIMDNKNLDNITSYDLNLIPCMVEGTKEQYNQVVKWILNWNNNFVIKIGNKEHISDMYIFQAHKEVKVNPLCFEYGTNRNPSLVHCKRSSFQNNDKKRKEIIQLLSEDPALITQL